MPGPLLRTKLYLPKPRPGLVQRPRLRARLDAATAAKLVLVSAPAGFGKTTLLADWLAAGSPDGQAPDGQARDGQAPDGQAKDGRSTAWLSLDRGDNDPASFWTYVIAALQTVAPAIGASEVALLASPQPPPIHRVLTTVLNDLGPAGSDIVLVLDDYHLIETREIHEAMVFLLDHLPPRLHLVIAGRADPSIPLARLRARADLVEIRAADLRFTPDEAAAYLNGVMKLRLTAQDVAALGERTEGWIAALQLAALSIQGRDDATGFIAGFTGDDRYIVDYLAEEVLQRQTQDVRDFLLQTSLLGRLNGSLCDAVTGQADGKAMLENLDHANLFVVPLDDRRQSYRYHHLFADVLRARLSDESPELAQRLHRRASDWYAASGDHAEAIEHALAGGHFDRAADLVELAMTATRRNRQEGLARSWLERLPAQVLAVRPALSNGYAGALLGTGRIEGVEAHLRNAERWLDQPPGAGQAADQLVVVDAHEFRRLPAAVAIHRAGLALLSGDPAATVTHARRALDLLEHTADLREVDLHLGRAAASALIGLASWSAGDLDTAHQAYRTSVGSMRRADHRSDVLGLSIALADIQITQGRLGEAMRTFEQALQLASEAGLPALRGTADMYVGLSALRREQNDLVAARQLLVRSQELGEHNGLPQNRYRWRVALAGIHAAEGNVGAAVDLVIEAERVYVGDFSPEVRPVSALLARMRILQGRVPDALEWARQRGLSGDDELSYLHEYEHVTLARALLARHQSRPDDGHLGDATQLLTRLLVAADAGHRTGSVIEILILQALAHQMRGDLRSAAAPLERALMLAEPQGYVRIFVDQGAAMTALLSTVPLPGVGSDYLHRLLTASDTAADSVADSVADRTPSAGHVLISPLSGRELDVLRLLGTDLGGPQIARRLVVSLNTVRTHTKNIYAKLGVNNRRAAVRRATELNLISRPADHSVSLPGPSGSAERPDVR